jgi:hypothetical protein
MHKKIGLVWLKSFILYPLVFNVVFDNGGHIATGVVKKTYYNAFIHRIMRHRPAHTDIHKLTHNTHNKFIYAKSYPHSNPLTVQLKLVRKTIG